MTSFFDSHCHLQMSHFASDLPQVLERARGAGWEGGVVIGMDVGSSRQAIELARRHEGLYATVGMHPHEARNLDAEALAMLTELAKKPKVVAVGETGLDFYRNLSTPALQRKAFREQLKLAAETGLPVVIHARQAQEETFAILREWAGNQPTARRPLGVLHCFAGDTELAASYVELGFMVSFAGNVTYPNARKLQAAAASVALESLLVETDCPFLAPQSRRGKRCEPAYVFETIQFIAGLREGAADEVASATAVNARRLYRL